MSRERLPILAMTKSNESPLAACWSDWPFARRSRLLGGPARSGFAEAFRRRNSRRERSIELFKSLHAARRWLNDMGNAARPAARLHNGVPVRC